LRIPALEKCAYFGLQQLDAQTLAGHRHLNLVLQFFELRALSSPLRHRGDEIRIGHFPGPAMMAGVNDLFLMIMGVRAVTSAD